MLLHSIKVIYLSFSELEQVKLQRYEQSPTRSSLYGSVQYVYYPFLMLSLNLLQIC